MENIIMILIVGMLMLLSFYLGSKTNKNIELKPKLTNPIKQYKENKVNEEQARVSKLEEEQFKVSMENINKYNGFEFGQQDIPE